MLGSRSANDLEDAGQERKTARLLRALKGRCDEPRPRRARPRHAEAPQAIAFHHSSLPAHAALLCRRDSAAGHVGARVRARAARGHACDQLGSIGTSMASRNETVQIAVAAGSHTSEPAPRRNRPS